MSKKLFFSENLEKLTLNEPQKESKITQSIEVTAANKPAKKVKNIIEKEKTENKKLNMVIYDYIKKTLYIIRRTCLFKYICPKVNFQ